MTDIVVFFPNLLIVFLLFKIEEVGFTANETIISWPEEMYKEAGLDAKSIEAKVLETLNSKVLIKKTN